MVGKRNESKGWSKVTAVFEEAGHQLTDESVTAARDWLTALKI